MVTTRNNRHHRTVGWLLASLPAVLLVIAVCACSGTGPATTDDAAPRTVALSAVEHDLAALDAPTGIDPAVMEGLKQALCESLSARGVDRFTAAAPTSELSVVDDLTFTDLDGGAVELTWTYRNQGDTNQDKEVNVSDLTPLGIHYGKNESAGDWAAASFADTDGNGLISVTDITPIGQNYLASVDGYYIQVSEGDSPDGTWTEVGAIGFDLSVLTGPGTPRTFTYVLDTPQAGMYYRVVPADDGVAGVPGNPVLYKGPVVTGYNVSGVCLDLERVPLPGVTLSLTGADPVVSGADGSFTITSVPDATSAPVVPQLDGVSLEPAGLWVAIAGADVTGLEFVATTIPVYSIYLDPTYIAELDVELWAADYKPGQIVCDGVYFDDVGIRYRGGAAMTFPKKSWKVDFPDEEYLDPDWDYERGKLNIQAEYTDTTLMREQLTYDLMHDYGLLAPRSKFVKLYVNDAYYGLMTDVENPRRAWLREFGMNDEGAMYKAVISKFFPLDTVAEYEEAFEKEFPDDEPYDDLVTFIESVYSWDPATEIYANYPTMVDITQLQNYLVCYCLVSMGDQIETNYILYNDSADSGTWFIIPWDHDRTWGHRWDSELGFFSLEIVDDTAIDYGSFYGDELAWGNILYDRYLNDTQFRAEYVAALQSALDNEFREDLMIARIDDYAELIRDAALADPNKWGENADWDQRVEDLREYVRLRRAFIADSIAAE